MGGQIESPNPPRVTGRIIDIAVDPDHPLMHWYVAADSGGIWETTDGGLHWTPRTDGEFSLRMNTITLAPSDP
ncbi:MAG TPA: hypothetical protein VEX43_18220, partial [Chthoniobacterales bacterium]|nr:hypothetical protein [Chthoniobacterales bacterium]